MTEVEIKAALTAEQAEALPKLLAGMGFQEKSNVREIDVYWNGNDRDFRKTDEALRLRSVENLADAATQSLLTYKGAKQDARSSTRQEYEVAVDNMDTAGSLLSALGYQAIFTVDKMRTEVQKDGITACLDTVAGLGSYLELETLLESEAGRDAAVDALLALLDSLRVSRDALTRKSYLELLMRK